MLHRFWLAGVTLWLASGSHAIYLSSMRSHITNALLIFLAFNTVWFFLHSVNLGWRGLISDDPGQFSRVFLDGTPMANAALALHMITGALLTIGAPIQALPVLRRKWPGLHKRSGYALVALALLTGFAGLFYILVRGTVGGWWMSLWFAIYGCAVLWSAVNTLRHAVARNLERHFRWATRLVILAVGSWIYRMHYVVWYALTGGLASNEALTGPFDRIQVVAFFVPYLLISEFFLRRETKPVARTS